MYKHLTIYSMTNDTFRIGLCMAGAVSAGAYTAGVMDYLIEALEEWEKQRGNPDIPSHKVVVPVMGGASAGGMTTIVTASALNGSIEQVPVPSTGDLMKEHPENKFYNTWVDLLGEDMFSRMLTTNDIKEDVVSLLNSQFIDEIAHKITSPPTGTVKQVPPFFEMPVKIFTTLSNLEGFDYNIDFNSKLKKEKYIMTLHNDYACFGLYDNEEQKAKIGEGWLPLNFKNGENTATAKDAAMATGAFPFGLKSRDLNRPDSNVHNIKWLKEYFVNPQPKPEGYQTLNVDGGMINNEPFEKVRDLLDSITKEKELLKKVGKEDMNKMNIEYDTFVNTVLMIDPFPSKPKENRPPFDYDKSLFSVLGKLFTAVTNQMKVKPEDYMLAMEDTHASQYLITPSRYFKDADGKIEEVSGDMAIACGSLGGFGGFISKEFRIHDYYLGRFNCEIFLRDYFTIPEKALENNEIFKNGYAGVVNKEKFKSSKDNSYQIIPILKDRPEKGYFPMPVFSNGNNWPLIEEGIIDGYKPKIKRRVQKVILNLFKLGFVNRILIFAGAKIVLNRMLTDKTLDAIKNELLKWKLLIKNR